MTTTNDAAAEPKVKAHAADENSNNVREAPCLPPFLPLVGFRGSYCLGSARARREKKIEHKIADPRDKLLTIHLKKIAVYKKITTAKKLMSER